MRRRLSSAWPRRGHLHKDVVDGDVDQLDEVADDAHDAEADRDSLAELDVLWGKVSARDTFHVVSSARTLLSRLGTPVDELEKKASAWLAQRHQHTTHVRALLDEGLGDLDKLLEGLGHVVLSLEVDGRLSMRCCSTRVVLSVRAGGGREAGLDVAHHIARRRDQIGAWRLAAACRISQQMSNVGMSR